jgi:hypothetical protein
MTVTTKPDTHEINATSVQIDWLNRVSDISKKYRTNLRWLKKEAEDALMTGLVHPLNHQVLSETQRYNGALAELLNLRSLIFPQSELPEEAKERREAVAQQNEWIALAREENPNGVLGCNWFVKERS